ncbi:MAG: type I glyceraldehyde-3-phosphate dehydrogenase [Patescibacteria group bacterium]
MPIRVAINGFGRIGRNTFKAGFGRKDLKAEFVGINDLTDTETLAQLLRHDSVYGAYDHEVKFDEKNLIVDGKAIPVFAEKDPALLPWGKLKVDVVLECTGRFTKGDEASAHLKAGAKRVIVSAPVKGGAAPTYVLGVNDSKYHDEPLINNASCTTNCIAPVAQVMVSAFGVRKALMTTTHAVTAEQNLVDGPPPAMHRDLRRARSALNNIVPTTTGAAIATAETIPELRGIFDGIAFRVPVICGSIADFTFLLKRKVTEDEIKKAFRDAEKSPRFKGIILASDEPLVSTDIIKSSYSAVVDLGLIKVVDGDFVKVVAWYDNEWAYSCRLIEEAEMVGRRMKGLK